jgi:glycogen synthase
MKILHTVEFYSPSTGGAQEVVKQLSERMAEKGHVVTVILT